MEQYVEDDNWWNDADVIDLVEENGWEEPMACDSFEFCEAFPSFVPPPPAPPFMSELVQEGLKLDNVDDEERCIMCDWINSNFTGSLLSNTEIPQQRAWISMLIIVALASAMIGAILMIFLLRCRRLKVIPTAGNSAMLSVGYNSGSNKDGPSQNSTINSHSIPALAHSCGTLNVPHICTLQQSNFNSKRSRWSLKWWKKVPKNSLEDRANPYASVNDQASAVYAELNSASSSLNNRDDLYHGYLSNMYSEIVDIPLHAVHHGHQLPITASFRHMIRENAYENAVNQPSEQCLSSGCPSSTSSSAYYSDLSNPEQCSRTCSNPRLQRFPSRSCSTCCRPTRAHVQSVFSIPHCHTPHCVPPVSCNLHTISRASIRGRDLMPVALEVIPDNVAVDPQLLQNLAPNLTRNQTFSEIYDYETSLKRPLPPLPSRQAQGPQKRYSGNSESSEVHVPSQYV
ncbi:uncharacterized protein LOC136030094 [Artemia franciscana]|uniref:Uncharacterized protein n=1 Tax=Artemia franciscana TaxID=6661 RepID=A0AA88HBV1_ARTSF|nr:hypothetical protein QYM36_016256 [Artemia franciscana]